MPANRTRKCRDERTPDRGTGVRQRCAGRRRRDQRSAAPDGAGGISDSAAAAGEHSARLTIGRTVWRRETWHIRPAQGPAHPEDTASWARDLGLPRRVFVLSPGEIKPIYIDFGSPVLSRILCRQFRRAGTDFPGRPLRFTEMLPGPEDCWLAGEDGQRYTSELRLVAVDLTHTAPGKPAQPVT